MGIYPGITADCFGSRNNSVNYGFLFIGFALAGLLGPLMMQRLLDATGSYRPSFAAALVLVAAALLLTQICSRNMTRRDKSGFYSRSS